MRFLTTMFNAHICVSKIVMVYTTEPATGDPASVYADLDGGSTMTLMRLAKHSDALKAAKLIVRLLSNGMDITVCVTVGETQAVCRRVRADAE